MQFYEKILNTVPSSGAIALIYIAQAGFCIKTSKGRTIMIDLYLSDACERLFNFKRMIPSILAPEDVAADFYLITHHHADHLDPDTVPVVMNNPQTHFIVAPDCETFLNKQELSKERYTILSEGEEWQNPEIKIRTIFADHGDLAPDALGFLIEVEGIKIYHAGDTAFRPEEILRSLSTEVDIMIAPINGQYGNMTASEACKLGSIIKPKILIPCHFWMFVEHVSKGGVGDPATFLNESEQLLPQTKGIVMAPGECIIYDKAK